MAEMAVQGLLEFWPCKSVNNPNFELPITRLLSPFSGAAHDFHYSIQKRYKLGRCVSFNEIHVLYICCVRGNYQKECGDRK